MIEDHNWSGMTLIGETSEENDALITLFNFLPDEAKSKDSGWSLHEEDSKHIKIILMND